MAKKDRPGKVCGCLGWFILLILALAACDAPVSQVLNHVPALMITPAPTTTAGTTYIVTGPSPANARVEPVTIGPIRATFQPGDTVTVVATILGQTVGDSNRWHVIELDARRLYIHSSLLSPVR